MAKILSLLFLLSILIPKLHALPRNYSINQIGLYTTFVTLENDINCTKCILSVNKQKILTII